MSGSWAPLSLRGSSSFCVVGVELTRNRKDKTPFGQLPFLEDGEVKIAQSMAIARYLARKYKLDGET